MTTLVGKLPAIVFVVLMLASLVALSACDGSVEESGETAISSPTSTPLHTANEGTPAPPSAPALLKDDSDDPQAKTVSQEQSPAAADAQATVVTPKEIPTHEVDTQVAIKSSKGDNDAVVYLDTTDDSAIVQSVAAQDRVPPQASGGRDSEPKANPIASGPVEGETYTWEDGDRTLTVHLQADLAVSDGSDGSSRNIVRAQSGGNSIVARGEDSVPSDSDLPVFRSQSGSLMTLPGGVLVVLKEEWTGAQTNSFFADNGIKKDRVSELSYITNGFFIETDPGFPSLNLANQLAALDGVEVSSPNWWSEAVTR